MAKDSKPRGYVDLHAHLDGSITVPIARELARLQGVELPASDDDELLRLLSVPADCASLNDFLRCFDLPCSLLQTAEGLTAAVRLVLSNMAADGTAYAELRFAPQLHGERGMSQEEVVRAAEAGLVGAAIPANLILCCMRGEGNEAANEETVRVAREHLVDDGGAVALDLAGAEALFPTEGYRGLFGRVRELGIPFTIHAGEADGPASVRCALEMGAARIGHGVRAAEDPALVDELAERGIPLEMCPTSNRQTHAVEDMGAYPLVDFIERGVRVTVNTDDMAIERTALSGEFDYLRREFGFTVAHERAVTANAIDAAFTSAAVKGRLRTQLLG